MSSAQAAVSIRPARPEDAAGCADICYRAFCAINAEHNFPPEMPVPEIARGILDFMFSDPSFYCVVAEAGGRLLGSNCLDQRNSILGIGPITVDPDAQNSGIGKRLMQAVLDRTVERGAPGVRLVQATFHRRSLSLYTKLGFVTRELVCVMHGPAVRKAIDGYEVRHATDADLPACNRLCEVVHGHHRGGELAAALHHQGIAVVERAGRLTGYTCGLSYFGHTVGETTEDLEALVAAAAELPGPGMMVPAGNTALFQWCLANGLRIVQPNTLMSIGLFNEPAGAWMPSILY
jgi:predicted N-acetyltransferase YhbS